MLQLRPGATKKKKKKNPTNISILKEAKGDFSGGPVAGTLCSQCRGPRFNPWSENYIPHTATKTQ